MKPLLILITLLLCCIASQANAQCQGSVCGIRPLARIASVPARIVQARPVRRLLAVRPIRRVFARRPVRSMFARRPGILFRRWSR